MITLILVPPYPPLLFLTTAPHHLLSPSHSLYTLLSFLFNLLFLSYSSQRLCSRVYPQLPGEGRAMRGVWRQGDRVPLPLHHLRGLQGTVKHLSLKMFFDTSLILFVIYHGLWLICCRTIQSLSAAESSSTSALKSAEVCSSCRPPYSPYSKLNKAAEENKTTAGGSYPLRLTCMLPHPISHILDNNCIYLFGRNTTINKKELLIS